MPGSTADETSTTFGRACAAWCAITPGFGERSEDAKRTDPEKGTVRPVVGEAASIARRPEDGMGGRNGEALRVFGVGLEAAL